MKKIVIIGGGINGLIAANYLAKEKYNVTVVEKKSFTGKNLDIRLCCYPKQGN